MTIRATWNGAVLAESPDTVEVEGHHYFPAEAVCWAYLLDSDTRTSHPWKGTASFYSIEVAGIVNRDAAWTYPEPQDAAAQIAGRVAFWRGVAVERI